MALIFKPLCAAGFAFGLACGGAAFAQAPPGTVQNGLNTEQQRVNQGVNSGQLTPREDANEEAHEQSIQAQRNQDLRANGGHLTPAERAHLDKRLNYNSGRVYRLKHNDAKDHPGA
jgi:hypothetical protein